VSNILNITANVLKITFRKRSNILVFLLLPVIIVVLIMAVFGNSSSRATRIGVTNFDRGVLAERMIKELEKTDKFLITILEEDQIKAEVSEGRVDAVLKIPDSFSEDIYTGSELQLSLISIKAEDATAWIEVYVNLFVANLLDISEASEGDREVFNAMFTSFMDSEFALTKERLEDVTNSKAVTTAGVGFLIMFMMLSSSVTSSLILKEKKNRTYFRIMTAPVSSRQYIVGNLLANLAIIFAKSVLVIIGITRILGLNTFIPDLQLLFILMCFGIASVGFGMIIVAFSDSTAQAGNLSTLLITPTCMLGGCFWSVDLMPEPLQRISSLTPQRWVLDAISKLQDGTEFRMVTLNIVITLGFAAAFFLIAAYKTSRSNNIRNFV
jgi:ABC-2 type transport system permease protein